MYCKNCGSKIEEGNTFCTNCGAKVDTENKRNKRSQIGFLILSIIIVIIALIILSNVLISNKAKNMGKNIQYYEKTGEFNNLINNNNSNILETIYSKYPELRNVNNYICTNGEEYWILNEQGKKIYFDSLESFDNIKKIVNKDDNTNNKTIDKDAFLSNYINDDFKQILRKNVLEYEHEKKEVNFIEDRIEVDSEQIIYTYIYVYQNDKMKPSLTAAIFVVVPTKNIADNLNKINSNFNFYFVAKRADEASEMFMDYSGIVTDDQIKEKMPLINNKIEEKLSKMKNDQLSNDRKKVLGMQYLNYLANIPIGYDYDTYSTIASKYNSDFKNVYSQILDSNRILTVRSYIKTTKSPSYNVSGYSEYIAAGACLTLNKLPYVAEKFTIQELIQTGYVIENSNNCVITPVKKVMNTDGYTKEDYEQMYKEQDNYIRQNLGI